MDTWEVTYSGNPLNNAIIPGPVGASVAVTAFTSVAESGIAPNRIYTHAISGGAAVTVNSVPFAPLTNLVTPARFTWQLVGGGNESKNNLAGALNNWVPANGGLDPAADPDDQQLIDLLSSFTYMGGGDAGEAQVYKLSGLTPGDKYVLKLHIRTWDSNITRPVNLIFTNGTETVQPYFALPEDKPGNVLGNGNPASAYALSLSYTAQGTELVIRAESPALLNITNATFHLYGLTNELVVVDTDNDGSGDGWEIAKGGDPLDNTVIPASASPSVKAIPFTSVAGSGIDPGKTYTHAISGNNAVTVNSVPFAQLTGTITPPGFGWTVNGGTKDVLGNVAAWVPVSGGLDPLSEPSDQQLIDLLTGFAYMGQGGSSQTYTLTGLTPGTKYDLRLYIRTYGPAVVRAIDLVFTNGTEVVQPFNALPEDLPGVVLGNGNDDSAYYPSFTYTAQGTELVIDAKQPTFGNPIANFHLYALTNEVAGPGIPPLITAVTRTPAGAIVIDFLGAPNTSYDVTKSADLTSGFVPLTAPLSGTTNGTGFGQVTVPAAEASEPAEFYRLEE